jgi:modification methylase
MLECGYLQPGQAIYFEGKQEQAAVLQADGSLKYQDQRGSIHLVARQIRQAPCNGWDVWFYEHPETGELCPVNDLRQQYLREHLKDSAEEYFRNK